MSELNRQLRTAVVGIGGMGAGHGRNMAALADDYRIVAGVDVDEAKANEFAAKYDGAKPFTDFGRMLKDVRPDVVVIATGPVPRAAMTIQAAEAHVRGIYAEKPMAVSLGEARAMVDACRRHNVALAINHQRRMSGPYRTMKRLMDEGAIGRVELIRGVHAGDVLSDGTHTVDLIRHLTGDAECRWVLGQVFRDRPNPEEPRGMGFKPGGGWRYGHPVETGAVALMEFANGLRAEVHSGLAQVKGRAYQDFEVFGTQGRLWRAGDSPQFPLMLQDTTGGFRQVPVDDAHLPGNPHAVLMANVFRQFAAMIRDGAPHPLSGESALKGHEIVMAIYESARTRSRIELPLKQDAFPLQVMVDEGQM